MKKSLLARAISVAFAGIALTACGSSDHDLPLTTTTPAPVPTPAPVIDTTADSKLANIIADAKAKGLSDENATKFAESVKDLDIGSESYATALAAALAAQQAQADTAKPVSTTVQTHNPFIKGVDTTKQLTSGASFYTRQSGSTYDHGANVGDPAGLGGVATDDPTGDGGNPYLSNFVLGVEAINDTVKAIDSTGEYAYQAGADKQGTKINPTDSPYAKNDGLRYNTQRTQLRYDNPDLLKDDQGRDSFGNVAGNNDRVYPRVSHHLKRNYSTKDGRGYDAPDVNGLQDGRGFDINSDDSGFRNGRVDRVPDPTTQVSDFHYDYSETLYAPIKNTDWKAGTAKYEQLKTWGKWGETERDYVSSLPSVSNPNSYPITWSCTDYDNQGNPFPTTCHGTAHDGVRVFHKQTGKYDQTTYGDIDPWLTGTQHIGGNNHARYHGGAWNRDGWTRGQAGYPFIWADDNGHPDSPVCASYRASQGPTNIGTCDVYNASTENDPQHKRRISNAPVKQENVESAHWEGNRRYRLQAGEATNYPHNPTAPLANNQVDDLELPYLANKDNAKNGGMNAPDCTDTANVASLVEMCQNSTIDFVGKQIEDSDKFRDYGFFQGHGTGYNTNPYEAKNANLEDAFGRKIYTLQEMNRRKVKLSEEAVTDAETFAKFIGTQAEFDELQRDGGTSQALNVNVITKGLATDEYLRVNADPYYTIRKNDGTRDDKEAIEKQRRYDTGLIVYNNLSQYVTGEQAKYGYLKPVFGVEENVYITDESGNKLTVINHIYDDNLAGSEDSVKAPAKIDKDKNSFFAVAKERRIVYHQPCASGYVGDCKPYERKGFDWADNKSVATTRRGDGTQQGGRTENNNAWDENEGDTRIYKDTNKTTYNDGLDTVNTEYQLGFDTWRRSIFGVDEETWKRMQPWQRLTVLRESRNPIETGVPAVKVANNLETRIYGKNYRDLEAGAEGYQDSNNTYVGRYKAVINEQGGIDYQMTKIGANKLHDVQYGRLTNNIDKLTVDEINKVKEGEKRIIYRQFQEHGAPNTVDTYFYRGTHRTTMEQMDALKARGGVIQYLGHALTYNLGPKVKTADNASLPTAYGLTAQESTIGNFVQAKFDTAQGKVEGSIYNFINKDVANNPDKFLKQDLVHFNGDVYGNTVTGTATKLGTNELGTLTASFYGENANELGGAVNSLTREQGYGEPKWGAVFGATRGTMVEQFNVIETNNQNP